jgi:Sec-independent protein secretion pathway component TatC
MRSVIALIVIFFASFVAAFLLTPPDPWTYYLTAVGILCLTIPSYLVGLRHGRMSTEMRDKPEGSG